MAGHHFPLIESYGAVPVFVDGVATVHFIGPNAHVIFSQTQPDTYNSGMQRVVSVRMVIPIAKLAEIGHTLASGRERRLDYTEDDEARVVARH